MVIRTNLLVTGSPGTGKTTLVRGVAQAFAGRSFGGFYTGEIREGGTRVGFELAGFAGARGVLAHTRTAGSCRVGKYGVDVSAFEAFLGAIDLEAPDHEFTIIDEIGRMEWYSSRFRTMIGGLLDGERPLLATIALKGPPEIEAMKERNDVLLRVITRENRNRLLPIICRDLEAMLGYPAGQIRATPAQARRRG